MKKFYSFAAEIIMLGCFFCLLSRQSVQAEELSKGLILERVFCLHDASQSYVLFLPSAYQSDRSWPIVYCFDPSGRGIIPVALFKAAAEKYGYILVGSNNSKNGPWTSILKAARAFWRDTHVRLVIDDARIYTAGFSGGARAACGFGKMLSIKLSGVIACGAGLPEWLEPEDFIDVAWFGTVGLHDFNYAEMQKLAEQLHAQGTLRRLETFPGWHSWPPPELAMAAIEWLKLHTMKTRMRYRLEQDNKKNESERETGMEDRKWENMKNSPASASG